MHFSLFILKFVRI